MEEFSLGQPISSITSATHGIASTTSQEFPPIPQPRKGNSSKNPITLLNLSFSKKSPNSHQNSPRSSNAKANILMKTASLDSSIISEMKLASLSNIPDHSDGDSDEEEEHNSGCQNGTERFSNLRPKRPHQRFVSRSLPVTPRVNGNCSTAQSSHNGVISSPFASGVGGASTPLLASSHLATHLHFEGSFNSIGSLSPSTSQYVTCTSGLMNESADKVLPGSIDYSSLPLPKEDYYKTSSRRNNISRHMSEPSIHDIPLSYLSSMGKCSSCPQRKGSFKHRRRDAPVDNDSNASHRFGDYKMDDVDGVETQWQFIRTLIDELNKSRSQSNRMTVELHQCKMEIQMLKATLESYTDAGIQPGIITEMVGQIHAAQKVRDEAMMSRIKLANEERDAALIQTQSLLEKLGLSPRSGSDHTYMSAQSIHNEEVYSFDEELKALRSVLAHDDVIQDKYSKNLHHLRDKSDQHSQEILEDLKSKLNESECSRVHLQDRCAKLERVFGSLGRKMNGLNIVETSSIMNRSSMSTLTQMSSGDIANHESFSSSGTNASHCLRRGPLDQEIKDSSLESESSGSSFGLKDPPSFTVNSGSMQSTITPPSTSHSPLVSTLTRSEYEKSHSKDVLNNTTTYGVNDYRTKNLSGVPIMGPITEL